MRHRGGSWGLRADPRPAALRDGGAPISEGFPALPRESSPLGAALAPGSGERLLRHFRARRDGGMRIVRIPCDAMRHNATYCDAMRPASPPAVSQWTPRGGGEAAAWAHTGVDGQPQRVSLIGPRLLEAALFWEAGDARRERGCHWRTGNLEPSSCRLPTIPLGGSSAGSRVGGAAAGRRLRRGPS